MPAVPLDFRAICGTFVPARSKIYKMAEYDFGSEIPDLKGTLMSGLSSTFVPILCVTMIILRFNNLLLCGDIEENPGPAMTDLGTINAKLDSILEGMQLQRNALNEQKMILEKQAVMMGKYEKGQNEMKQDIEGLRQEIDFLKEQNEKHEQYSRRKNIRLYDVPETQGREDSEKTVSNILNKYFPDNDLQIERAHRIGRKRRPNDKPRPLICRFLDWRDAMTVMKAREIREIMRKDGINVAQDLTMNQFEQLRCLKNEGKRGYFYRGKIYEKEFPSLPRHSQDINLTTNENSQNNNSPSRQSSPANENANFFSRQFSSRDSGSESDNNQNGRDPRIISIQTELERQKDVFDRQREQSEILKSKPGKQRTSLIPSYIKNSQVKGKVIVNTDKNGPITRSRQPRIDDSMMACNSAIQSKPGLVSLSNPSSTDVDKLQLNESSLGQPDQETQMSDGENAEDPSTWG